MALAQNRLIASLWGRFRTKVGVRFTRFVGVAAASLATSEIALTLCNGVFHMTSTPAAIIAWFSGAVVSYVLSRWAWERKGRPDVLRETVPFWVISAMVVVILWLATKLGYHIASWMGLPNGSAAHVLVVDFVYLIANFATFLLRFLIFHYVLFAEPTTAARAAATGPDAIPPGTRRAPNAAEAPHSAAPAVTAEAATAATAPAPATATSANGTNGTSASAAGPASANRAANRRTAAASSGTAAAGSAAVSRGTAKPKNSATPPAAPSPTAAD